MMGLTWQQDKYILAVDIAARNVCTAAFGHTRPTISQCHTIRFKAILTFCFLLWHSVHEVLNFNRPSANWELL